MPEQTKKHIARLAAAGESARQIAANPHVKGRKKEILKHVRELRQGGSRNRPEPVPSGGPGGGSHLTPVGGEGTAGTGVVPETGFEEDPSETDELDPDAEYAYYRAKHPDLFSEADA